MLVKTSVAILAVLVASAIAQTSLYIPGFDPQPISADILGVDSQGRTTWALHQGALTGTFSDPSIPGTATLVEGADYVSFTYDLPAATISLGRECSLSAGLAICSATISGEAVTETETASPILVQVGTTAPLAATTNNADTTTTNASPSSPTALSSQPGSSAQTSEKTSSAPSPTHSSSAQVSSPFLFWIFVSAALVISFVQL